MLTSHKNTNTVVYSVNHRRQEIVIAKKHVRLPSPLERQPQPQRPRSGGGCAGDPENPAPLVDAPGGASRVTPAWPSVSGVACGGDTKPRGCAGAGAGREHPGRGGAGGAGSVGGAKWAEHRHFGNHPAFQWAACAASIRTHGGGFWE